MKNLITYVILFLSLSVTSLSQISEFKILPGDGAAGDYFGMSVSMSGNYAVVGTPYNNDSTGAAYVFRLEGLNWIEEQKLVASDGSQGDGFGFNVAISDSYIVVGANNDSIGAAYVFRREGLSWIEEQKLQASDGIQGDGFSNSVSISGDYVVIGAHYSDSFKGSAYIFRKEGNNWIEAQKLMPGDSVASAHFGYSVSIYEDRAVIGAVNEIYLVGSAYIFKREGTSWIEEQKIIASDGAAFDWFGWAVSMFGEYVIIGTLGARSAYIFKKENAYWSEEQKLIASDGSSGKDFYGASVSIWKDYVVIGAFGVDSSSGSAYIFNYNGSNWIERTKLTATDRNKSDGFGFSVSVSGNNIIIGAAGDDDNGENSGSAYIYNGFVVGVENEETEFPLSFRLEQNYPNPFNPNTIIKFSIPSSGYATLKIYNALGEEVAVLIDKELTTGTYKVEWNASYVPSGVYFYQLKIYPANGGAEGFVETKKMILMK
jgi:hypothetical protein